LRSEKRRNDQGGVDSEPLRNPTATGHAANALVRAAVTDIGEGGALYDEGVRLRAG